MVLKNPFTIVILFSVLFGVILYVLTTFLLKRFGKEQKGKRTKRIFVWRISLFLVLLYVFVVLLLNKEALELVLLSTTNLLLMAFLFVFFITLSEIAIIDLFLPDVLELWKRIGLEVIIFFLLSTSSMFMFIVLFRFVGV